MPTGYAQHSESVACMGDKGILHPPDEAVHACGHLADHLKTTWEDSLTPVLGQRAGAIRAHSPLVPHPRSLYLKIAQSVVEERRPFNVSVLISDTGDRSTRLRYATQQTNNVAPTPHCKMCDSS